MGKVHIPPELMQRIASGDDRAFEQLYRLTFRPVYSFLLSMTANHDDAMDILQETYIRVHGSAHLYREQGNPMAWIMTIARNLFLMEKRKRRALPVEAGELAARDEPSFDDIADHETRMFLRELFENLTEEERTIVVMHAISGFRHREIAEIMDLPLGTVLSKYNRSMKKLATSAKGAAQGG